jgi:hypothetical protein
VRDAVRHQASIAGSVLPRYDDGLPYGLVVLQGRLDFSQFDAVAAELHLVIEAPEKLDVAVRQVTGQIPCLIKPRARIGTEGVWNESLGSQLWPIAIPLG